MLKASRKKVVETKKKKEKEPEIIVSPRTKAMVNVVNELILDCHTKFDIQYHGLVNHTVHGLIALFALKVSEDTIRDWYSEYIGHEYSGKAMEPAKPLDASFKINSENYELLIGAEDHFAELCSFFENELNSMSLEEAVLKYYPKLMKGVAGAAFHGLIHFGWALYYRKSRIAITEGFAYLTFVNTPTPFSYEKELDWEKFGESEGKDEENSQQIAEELFQVFLKVRNERRFLEVFQGQSRFGNRVTKLLTNFDQLIFEEFTSKTSPFSIKELIIAICKLFYYSDSNNFFLLHLLTALFGVHHLLSFPFDKKTRGWVIWNFFHLSVITYIAEGFPKLTPRFSSFDCNQLPLVLRSWDDIQSAYLTNIPVRNEHILKVVMTLKEFDAIVPHHSALFKHCAIDSMRIDHDRLLLYSNGDYVPIKYTTPSTRQHSS